MTSFGKVELKKDHVLSQNTRKFGISTHIQELMCLLGQTMVYEEASEVFLQTIHLDISASQIQRVCGYYGNALDPLITTNCKAVIPRLKSTKKEDTVYVMIDGSMIFTREDKWKEIKLGRIFYSSQVAQIQKDRREILRSIYVNHLGSVDQFFPKFERYLVPYRKKVILGDGAKWIWNWAEDNYPGAIQILDYFHAKEKLVLFAKHQFKEDHQRKQWIKDQEEKLLNDDIENVMKTIKKCRSRNAEAKETKQKLINYYEEHEDRMQYKTFQKKGLMIGSGPIEAAHRNVIQQRMKLSGQKWSIPGAQAIANLRCYKMSDSWRIIKKVISAAA